ncbi:hypothetical protein POKO110462_02760 [Pontibacter korlensis]|uniref:Uncharacterized protein n=1 Tax=Pontibacter korlensis TaxID=400092 RepID=A0A0E3ZE78_9BACT|nr:hypothetical protein PKOR_11385 [Pontibacter korlensis]
MASGFRQLKLPTLPHNSLCYRANNKLKIYLGKVFVMFRNMGIALVIERQNLNLGILNRKNFIKFLAFNPEALHYCNTKTLNA